MNRNLSTKSIAIILILLLSMFIFPLVDIVFALDPLGDDDQDGISNGTEQNILGTDPLKKTLFVRPKHDLGRIPSQYQYWDKFIQIFPDSRPGFANIPAFTNAGIEIMVIGDPNNPYPPMRDFAYAPAADPNHPPCDILEIINKDSYFSGSPNQGHTHFSTNDKKWYWDTKGYCPGTPGPYGYKTPEVYQLPLDNYFIEGAYNRIAVGEKPITINCSSMVCNLTSPLNLNSIDPVNGLPDSTVEFNNITFDDGSITGTKGTILSIPQGVPAKGYDKDTVLRRTTAHEMGHAVLDGSNNDHCTNPQCILDGGIPDWDMHDFGGGGGCKHSPGAIQDVRAYGVIHDYNRSVTPPQAPTLSAPVNGAKNVSLNPTLRWNTSIGATTYRVQVCTSSTCYSGGVVIDKRGITATSLSITGLSKKTTYYWRVNASNDGGPGAWSSIWKFITDVR